MNRRLTEHAATVSMPKGAQCVHVLEWLVADSARAPTTTEVPDEQHAAE